MMPRLFILSYINSIHTQRWIASLAQHGYQIFLFGLNWDDTSYYQQFKNVTVDNYNIPVSPNNRLLDWIYGKIGFIRASRKVRNKIKTYHPDILHAHYATSYGLLGANANFHPYILSVWGSDVYYAPHLSFLHRFILKRNLKKADLILSTSHIMAKETGLYTDKSIEVIPFGVDIERFKKIQTEKNSNTFRIGVVKSLKPVYGIDTLISAFNILLEKNKNLDLELMIVGDGAEYSNLKQLAITLGIEKRVNFSGFIENEKLPEYYNHFDVAVFLSERESFGVSAVEAMACETPVVTSDADGFTEVVENELTGLIVPKQNPQAAAKAIQRFIDDPSLKNRMGKAGRERVLQLYDWDLNVEKMIKTYANYIQP